ncbi:LytR/AlgR family response regulator transcription factor [Dokdonia sp. 4H-3-7-5]|uniref:LytR/AlgR family response regulator transcription factor n=1 Tax=Dokdonia sp. (strain 4H-3-7-5) TaxID=983548 RepID=UPI00020A7720|nr:LytTR family DNA-binding domain-containing protein [Dokdonia sp. 4H-3-7-5]AEE20383.1 two component transcriptional regulator, LytTR family [Dokdonia sp. 4H-3-7-5]
MKKLRCIIVDDEELARTLLTTYVAKVAHVELLASFENPLHALSYIKENEVDLVFMDIQMPELKGTDFAELIINDNIKVIFTTAYSEYALKGFELNALDYLAKPITFKRFLAAINKFPVVSKEAETSLVIKSGYDLHRVLFQDMLYIESDSEYVNYHFEDGKKIMANQSLSKLLNELPSQFIRVHRSYIVNKNKVTSLKGRSLMLSNTEIPVSDSYFEAVKNTVFNK